MNIFGVLFVIWIWYLAWKICKRVLFGKKKFRGTLEQVMKWRAEQERKRDNWDIYPFL